MMVYRLESSLFLRLRTSDFDLDSRHSPSHPKYGFDFIANPSAFSPRIPNTSLIGPTFIGITVAFFCPPFFSLPYFELVRDQVSSRAGAWSCLHQNRYIR